jgi:uncharacterized protein (DUF2236 family)
VDTERTLADDAGLFGPASVTWRLHREPPVLVGGVRALVLQALEPRAMAGVVQHSTFAAEPVARLQRTSEYVTTITYGTTEQAERLARVVRAMHRKVVGVDPHSGRPYAASDPELQLYIHATLVESVLVAHRRYGDPVSAADGDRYVAEQVRAAELVGIPASMVPASEAELGAYLRGYPGLMATRDARATVWQLATLPTEGWMRPLWGVAFAAAMSSLPRWAKRLYRLPWFPPADELARPGLAVVLRSLAELAPPPPLVAAADQRVAGVAGAAA